MDKPEDLDVATVMSMGFPATKGGLIFWADLVGAAYIIKKLDHFASLVRDGGWSDIFWCGEGVGVIFSFISVLLWNSN